MIPASATVYISITFAVSKQVPQPPITNLRPLRNRRPNRLPPLIPTIPLPPNPNRHRVRKLSPQLILMPPQLLPLHLLLKPLQHLALALLLALVIARIWTAR